MKMRIIGKNRNHRQVKMVSGPGCARPNFRMTKNFARAFYFLIAFVVVVLDRWTKHLVAQRIRLYSHVQVIPGFFQLTHTENTGAAFSLFANSTVPWKTGMLIAFSGIA